MANAFLLKPLPFTVLGGASTVELGALGNIGNDYAGVVLQLACGVSGNLAYVDIDLGADTSFDTIMAFGVEKFPTGGTLTINVATAAQGSSFSGTPFLSGAVPYAGATVMTSGKGVSLWLGSSPVTARYIRMIYTAGVAAASVRLSRVAIGTRFQPTRNFSYGAGFGVKDLGSLDFSRRGVLLRTRGAKLRTASLTFSSIRKDEVEASVQPLLEYLGNTELVALCSDPTADTQRQNRCYFGPLVGDLGRTWRNAAAWEVKTNLVSIF